MKAVRRIPTVRNPLARLVNSKPFAMAFFIAGVVAVILVNLEKFQ